MKAVPRLLVPVLLALPAFVPAVSSAPCDKDQRTLRDVLDCADELVSHRDKNGACRAFVNAYDEFVETDKILNTDANDQERFLFEGGDRLLTYAGEPGRGREARISAAAHAESFFSRYVDWFTGLTEDNVKGLSNGGRVRSVMRHLGNTLIAEERKSDIHERYSFLFMSKGASAFGPEAMALWEQALKDTIGPYKDDKNSPTSNAQWQEFAKCLADWANVRGMLKTELREHYLRRSQEILGKLL
jgi:hypothetical protein